MKYTATTSPNMTDPATEKQIELLKKILTERKASFEAEMNREGFAALSKQSINFYSIQQRLKFFGQKLSDIENDNEIRKALRAEIYTNAVEWITNGCELPYNQFSKKRASLLIDVLSLKNYSLVDFFAISHTSVFGDYMK